jgi:hypothetical protein
MSSDGLWKQIDGKFINQHEAKNLECLATQMEQALMFGQGGVMENALQREADLTFAGHKHLGTLNEKELAVSKKLIDSKDDENLKLAIKIMNTYGTI